MKIAIITGASSGMGREVAIQAAKEEHFDEVWVIARREEALNKLKDEIDTTVRPICLDLAKPESFETMQKLLEEEKPEVALLANVAGFGKFGRVDEIPLSDCM